MWSWFAAANANGLRSIIRRHEQGHHCQASEWQKATVMAWLKEGHNLQRRAVNTMEEGLSKYYCAHWAVTNLADTSSSTFNRRRTARSVALVSFLPFATPWAHWPWGRSPLLGGVAYSNADVVGKGRWNHQRSWFTLRHWFKAPTAQCRRYPYTRLMGTGLVRVQIFVPIPIPLLTHAKYPHGFLYPCR